MCHIRVALFTHGLLFNLVEISMHKKAVASLYGFSLTQSYTKCVQIADGGGN
jgi:hypothetical protein